MPLSLKLLLSIIIRPPGITSLIFTFNAAGFIATNMSAWSPELAISPSPNLT